MECQRGPVDAKSKFVIANVCHVQILGVSL
jgi:hypothetical protein